MKIVIYARWWKRLFHGRKQWYWKAVKNGRNMAHGEGYYNLSELEDALRSLGLDRFDWEYQNTDKKTDKKL